MDEKQESRAIARQDCITYLEKARRALMDAMVGARDAGMPAEEQKMIEKSMLSVNDTLRILREHLSTSERPGPK